MFGKQSCPVTQMSFVGVKGKLLQEEPLWQEHYLELKAIKTQEIQKDPFISPSTACLYQEESYYWRFHFT